MTCLMRAAQIATLGDLHESLPAIPSTDVQVTGVRVCVDNK